MFCHHPELFNREEDKDNKKLETKKDDRMRKREDKHSNRKQDKGRQTYDNTFEEIRRKKGIRKLYKTGNDEQEWKLKSQIGHNGVKTTNKYAALDIDMTEIGDTHGGADKEKINKSMDEVESREQGKNKTIDKTQNIQSKKNDKLPAKQWVKEVFRKKTNKHRSLQ